MTEINMRKAITFLAAILVSFNANADLCTDISKNILELDRDEMRMMSERTRFEIYSKAFENNEGSSEDRKVLVRYLMAKVVEGIIWKSSDREAMGAAYEECTFFKQATGLK